MKKFLKGIKRGLEYSVLDGSLLWIIITVFGFFGVFWSFRQLLDSSEKLNNLLSSATTVAERYTSEDTAELLELITSSKLLIKYNDSTYKLVLEKPVDYIEGSKIDITVKYTEMESGSTYSTIVNVGDFDVQSCTKVID